MRWILEKMKQTFPEIIFFHTNKKERGQLSYVWNKQPVVKNIYIYLCFHKQWQVKSVLQIFQFPNSRQWFSFYIDLFPPPFFFLLFLPCANKKTVQKFFSALFMRITVREHNLWGFFRFLMISKQVPEFRK